MIFTLMHIGRYIMKKRGSDDFPFDDLAGPRKTYYDGLASPADKTPNELPGNSAGARSVPAPGYSAKDTAIPAGNVNGTDSGSTLRQPVQQNTDSGVPRRPVQQHPENGVPRRPVQQRPENGMPRQSAPQAPIRKDGYYMYPQQEMHERAPQKLSSSPVDPSASVPRPRTLNRQIQILSIIAAVMLIIVLILAYFTFFGDKKSTSGSSATAAAASVTVTDASGSAANTGTSDISVTPADTQGITATPAADNDPNSLANLPPSDEHPVIALTFDDGPSSSLTPELLTVLEEKGIHATFFMLGQMVEDADPAILQRMVSDGDELGNHSYDHSIYTGLTEDEVRSELTKTNDAIFAACGQYPTVMRPPTGGSNDTVLALSKELNLPVVDWSYQSCPEDWLKDHQTPEFISKYVIDNAANGHIVLLHDIHECTVHSISAMVDGLKAKGYRFATVSELLAAQPDGKQTGVLYYIGKY